MNESLLRPIPLFASLSDAELGDLAQYLQREEHPAHHTVFWMNERSHHLYIVAEGSVQISSSDEEGAEVSLARLGPGAFFGELSLLDGGPHTATARTAEPSTVLRLHRDSFYQFVDSHPRIAGTLLQVLAQRLRKSTERQRTSGNLNEQLDSDRSRFQRAVDKLASIFTSSAFLVCYLLFVTGWIVAQSIRWRLLHGAISYADAPPSFSFLDFLLTVFSSLLTVLILNSQRRQAYADRIRGEIEYQVNLKAQAEVVKLQAKMDEVLMLLKKTQ